MARSEAQAAPPAAADEKTRTRNRWFRVVLLGLLLLVAGFTFALVSNAFYPCAPAEGSTVQPPLQDCAAALSPWAALAVAGLLIAIAGYLRVH